MKLIENINLTDFLQVVTTCDGNVWFETNEGDHLNLKSELCKYLFATISTKFDILSNAYIKCDKESDYTLLAAYLKKE